MVIGINNNINWFIFKYRRWGGVINLVEIKRVGIMSNFELKNKKTTKTPTLYEGQNNEKFATRNKLVN